MSFYTSNDDLLHVYVHRRVLYSRVVALVIAIIVSVVNYLVRDLAREWVLMQVLLDSCIGFYLLLYVLQNSIGDMTSVDLSVDGMLSVAYLRSGMRFCYEFKCGDYKVLSTDDEDVTVEGVCTRFTLTGDGRMYAKKKLIDRIEIPMVFDNNPYVTKLITSGGAG